ncbi:sorting nexin-6 [Callorhinchus milii]|uniref:sorting nexin-6 n=1 Tax=Callorhinchus milii TaxID=7868 RepID=UPI001C3FD6AF|nr:sorting nexin-6 [Callorhinchus milii]
MESDEAAGAQSHTDPVFTVNITHAIKDGDSLTYLVKSTQVSDKVEYEVQHPFEDFQWLQHTLLTQEGIPGLSGIIFPPIPVKPGTTVANAEAKAKKYLGIRSQSLMGDDWHKYCYALEKYLQQVNVHPILRKNPTLLNFLTKKEPPMKGKPRKGIFNKLTQVVEEILKEHHKDIDDYFQAERESNYVLTAFTKSLTEKCLEMIHSEQRMAVACGHFSTALHIGSGHEADPNDYAVTKMCIKLSEAIDTLKRNFERVAKNNMNTLGCHLELYSRFQDAEKEMLFRRTCKLIEVENANRCVEKAKHHKKAQAEEVKRIVEREYEDISEMAKKEIQNYHQNRVREYREALVCLTECQLRTARETHTLLTKQLAELSQRFTD